jgi:hypothetical protein
MRRPPSAASSPQPDAFGGPKRHGWQFFRASTGPALKSPGESPDGEREHSCRGPIEDRDGAPRGRRALPSRHRPARPESASIVCISSIGGRR